MARIRLVKNASGQALCAKKRAHETRMHEFEQGTLGAEALKDEDIFELQHHHGLAPVGDLNAKGSLQEIDQADRNGEDRRDDDRRPCEIRWPRQIGDL